MKMLFLQSLQRPKWAASQVALSFSTRGLSTAQWSVTTAASIADMPTTITTDVILTLVACSSNMFVVFSEPMTQVCTSLRVCESVKVVFVLFFFRSLVSDVDSGGSHVQTKASLHCWCPLLLSKALSFSFSAFCLVVGKKGPDNSALVSTSLLSSSPSLVAFSELRPFKYK